MRGGVAPEGVTPERWDVIIDQLKECVGGENVITDPAEVKRVYNDLTARGVQIRKQQVMAVNDRFNEQLEQLTPENANSTILNLGMPSPMLQTAGMPNNPLRLYGNKLLKKAHRHGYDISDLRNLPQSIERPIAIFKGRYVGSFVLLTEIDINGKNAVATIDINKNSDVSLNLITSVYGKNADGIRSWIEESKLLYVGDKEKALEIASSSALNAGRSSNQGSVTATNIVTNFENPKIDAIDLRKSIVGAKSLLGVHNISEEGLLHAAKIGGLANPSLAVVDTANEGGFEKFGEITLVAPTSMVDKTSDNNAGVYGADLCFMQTPAGEVYGFTVDGKIYLDGAHMNANSPMHEYVELWSQIVAREMPELWVKGVEFMKQTEIWKVVNADPNYKHLSENKRVSETLARICAAKFEQKQQEITDDHQLMGKLRKWLRDFWKGLKATFSKWTRKDLDALTADKFAMMTIRDFVEGLDLRAYKGKANGEVRYMREFIERKITTLEKLESKRAEIFENREDIANFEQQLAKVDLQIEAYNSIDHVATTYGKDGGSDAHLKAVEDVVYDICRHFGGASQSYVVQDTQKFIMLLRELGATDAQMDDIDIDDCPSGVNWGDVIIIRADSMYSKSKTMVTYMHELAHLTTSTLFSFEQMYNVAEQIGADYMNMRLMQRHASYFADKNDRNSMVVAAGETISRVIDIYQRRGMLDAFFSNPHTGTDVLIESLERDSVPNVLQELIIKNLQSIKDTKYGTETKEQRASAEADFRLFFTRDGNATPDGQSKRVGKSGNSIQNSFGASDQGDSSDRSGRDGGGGSDLDLSIFDIQEQTKSRRTKKEIIDDLRTALRDAKAWSRDALRDEKTASRDALRSQEIATHDIAKKISALVREKVGTDIIDVMGKREWNSKQSCDQTDRLSWSGTQNHL